MRVPTRLHHCVEMASYGFSFRASTRKGGYPGRLYLRVVKGADSRSVTTEYRVYPDEWDAARRWLQTPYPRGDRGRQLAEIESSMMCDLRRMEVVIGKLKKKEGYTIDEIMGRYRAVMKGNTLSAYTDKLVKEMEQGGYVRTARAYITAAKRLIDFSGDKNLSYEHITPELLADFQAALKADGLTMNSVSNYMRSLRAIYNKAINEGRIARRSDNLFGNVYTGISTTRKRALSHEELETLSAYDPTERMPGRGTRQELPEHLQPGLAMFLFCYHARGMSFIDMAFLKKSDLRGDIIHYKRHKTGQAIELQVLPPMRRIIDWFAGQTAGSPYLFPVITDPDGDTLLQYESGLRLQNQRLKKIAEMCGIGHKFSTHSARHSWATVAKNAGLPLAVISEGLGHTNQRTTEIYMASLERSVLDHASRLVSEAIDLGRKATTGHDYTTDGIGGPSKLRSPYGRRNRGSN